MEPTTESTTAQSAVYEIGGRHFEAGSHGFAEAIAVAHAAHQRPRCMCQAHGVEMYVARLAGSNEGYIVKRMPATGSHHAPACPSYEPPAEVTGLGQVLGSAITEDPATGETTLKLAFPLTKMPGRSQMPPACGDNDSVTSDGTRLSMRGLLHYLWEQAELTRWHPGFAGKRTWATVRRHLLQAAEHKLARGDALRARLYIPEPFSVEDRDAINARRLEQWRPALAAPGQAQHLKLLIGEVKEIVRARYGFKAVVKHVPDQAFALDEQLYRRMGRRFEPELSLWGAADNVHMMAAATIGISAAGVPSIEALSLMPVTSQWLPIEDSFEKQLIEALVHDGRSFVKGLRYNMPAGQLLARAILLDTSEPPAPLFIEPRVEGYESTLAVKDMSGTDGSPTWVWRIAEGAMPALPARRRALAAGIATAGT